MPPGRVRVELGGSSLLVAWLAGGSMGTASWGSAVAAACEDPQKNGVNRTADTTERVEAESRDFARHAFGAQFAEVLVNSDTGEGALKKPHRRTRCVPQVPAMVVGVGAVDLDRLVPHHRLEALLRVQWNLTKVDRPAALTSRKMWTPKPSMKRNERGMARSDMIHISMWAESGISDTKSQKLSWPVCACGNPRCGLSRTKAGGRQASWAFVCVAASAG